MKNLFRFALITALVTFVLTSCEDDPVFPTAGFSYEPDEVMIYDVVTFTNSSTDAASYAWDFGDGGTSSEENPTHAYTDAGTYTVKLTATNEDGDAEAELYITVGGPKYTLDGTVYNIDADMEWYQSGMGGDPYIRLLTEVAGQEHPDLFKLYPNQGLGELPGTYTWAAGNGMMDPYPSDVGNYDVGYTAGYAGQQYDWTAIGKTGSGDLVISEIATDVYKVTGEFILSVGSYDFNTGDFIETSTSTLVLEFIGGVTPL